MNFGLNLNSYQHSFFFNNNQGYSLTYEKMVEQQTFTTANANETSKGSIYNGSETAGTIAYNYFCPNVNFSTPILSSNSVSSGEETSSACSSTTTSTCSAVA